jgi:hypothetical protein
MDLGSIFLILALLALVALFISRPFLERRPASPAETVMGKPESQEFSALLAERDRVINTLQELDFDQELGKIPQEDYPNQRAILVQRGADILRKLDSFQVQNASETAEARLEAAIAARRAALVPTTVPGNGAGLGGVDSEDELEIQIASRRRKQQDKPVGFCPQCGGPVHESDRFCSKCGAKLG